MKTADLHLFRVCSQGTARQHSSHGRPPCRFFSSSLLLFLRAPCLELLDRKALHASHVWYVFLVRAKLRVFSPQKCREDSQLSPNTTARTHHACVWGFRRAVPPKCQSVALWDRLNVSAALFSVGPEKGCKRLYCLPPLNGTLSRPGFSQSRPPLLNPPGVCACVFFPPLVSLVPNIFIDIFVCCSHLGPPCVNINLRRQPRPLIS